MFEIFWCVGPAVRRQSCSTRRTRRAGSPTLYRWRGAQMTTAKQTPVTNSRSSSAAPMAGEIDNVGRWASAEFLRDTRSVCSNGSNADADTGPHRLCAAQPPELGFARLSCSGRLEERQKNPEPWRLWPHLACQGTRQRSDAALACRYLRTAPARMLLKPNRLITPCSVFDCFLSPASSHRCRAKSRDHRPQA